MVLSLKPPNYLNNSHKLQQYLGKNLFVLKAHILVTDEHSNVVFKSTISTVSGVWTLAIT